MLARELTHKALERERKKGKEVRAEEVVSRFFAKHKRVQSEDEAKAILKMFRLWLSLSWTTDVICLACATPFFIKRELKIYLPGLFKFSNEIFRLWYVAKKLVINT